MTYRELFYKATRLINNDKITLCEYDEMTKPLDREIEQEPILVSDNATNGDMIKVMFPICCSNMGNLDNGIVVDFMGDLHTFNKNWWNTPYAEMESKENEEK